MQGRHKIEGNVAVVSYFTNYEFFENLYVNEITSYNGDLILNILTFDIYYN